MMRVYGQTIPAARPTPFLAALVAFVIALIGGGLIGLVSLFV